MKTEFFKLNINKIIIAKIFGIPLLIADALFNIFSYFHMSSLVKVILLIAGSYILACFIDNAMKSRSAIKQ